MLKYEPTCYKERCCWMRKTNEKNSLATAKSDQRIRYLFSAKFDS